MKIELMSKLATVAERIAAGLEDTGIAELRELAAKLDDPDARKLAEDMITAVDQFADKKIDKISEG